MLDKTPFHTLEKLTFHALQNLSYPIFLEVNLTDKCNMKCDWCITSNRGKNTIDAEALKEAIWDFKYCGGKAITFSGGGEPTLHPKFNEIVKEAVAAELDIGLMTNGLFPKDSIFDVIGKFKWIRMSIDTTDPVRYKKIKHSSQLDKVMGNAKKTAKLTKLGINCNTSYGMTKKEIDGLIGWSKHIGAKYIQFRPVLPRKHEDETIKCDLWVYDYLLSKKSNFVKYSSDKFIEMYAVEKGTWLNRKSFICEGWKYNPVIDADGTVRVCMYHPGDARFKIGSIYDINFDRLWLHGKSKMENFLETFNCKENCQICCKLYEINKCVSEMKSTLKDEDVNFL